MCIAPVMHRQAYRREKGALGPLLNYFDLLFVELMTEAAIAAHNVYLVP
jgi:hypothetical protein